MTAFHEEFRFGSARWAAPEHTTRAGLHGRSGPFLGYMGERPLRLPGDAPIITFGGAGSGKLRDVLAYNLCGLRDRKGVWDAPRRMLINDPRGELAAISIGNQIRMGKAAYCINPFGLHGLPHHRVNPWNILHHDSATFHADTKLLVADLIPLPAHGDDYFGRRARELSEALIKTHVAGVASRRGRDAISLASFYDLVNMMAIPSGWEALLRAYSYGRGMGLRTWSFWQDPGQIARNYGQAALSGFIGSSQCRQFFGVRDLDTARLVSQMLEQQTLGYDETLRQQAARTQAAHLVHGLMQGGNPFISGMNMAQSLHAAQHRAQQARALITPDEALNLPEDAQILFISGLGLAPIRANKRPYFTRPEMAGGYLPNPFHPPLDRVAITRRSWGIGRTTWARVVREDVPAALAYWPQHQTGTWAYPEGYRPRLEEGL